MEAASTVLWSAPNGQQTLLLDATGNPNVAVLRLDLASLPTRETIDKMIGVVAYHLACATEASFVVHLRHVSSSSLDNIGPAECLQIAGALADNQAVRSKLRLVVMQARKVDPAATLAASLWQTVFDNLVMTADPAEAKCAVARAVAQ